MKTEQKILGIIAIIAAIIIAVSFVALKSEFNSSIRSANQDKAEPLYIKAEDFLKRNEYDRASSTLLALIKKYPESSFAELSMQKLIQTYEQKGDKEKVLHYQKEFLEKFPDSQNTETIRSFLEKLNMDMLLSPVITEGSIEYIIKPGDTLFGIAKKHNTTISLIKKINNLKSDIIYPGKKLKIVVSEFSIFVDKKKNVLLLKKDSELFKTYTISTGEDNSTPVGVFKIEEKMVKPLWYKVGAVVSADSEEYELGERWMGLSVEGYGIHGTSDETTIGKQITQGCVRMCNADVEELFDIVPSGTKVEIVDGI